MPTSETKKKRRPPYPPSPWSAKNESFTPFTNARKTLVSGINFQLFLSSLRASAAPRELRFLPLFPLSTFSHPPPPPPSLWPPRMNHSLRSLMREKPSLPPSAFSFSRHPSVSPCLRVRLRRVPPHFNFQLSTFRFSRVFPSNRYLPRCGGGSKLGIDRPIRGGVIFATGEFLHDDQVDP